MNARYEDFKGRGFTLLLVNMGEDAKLVRLTVKRQGYTAPVLLDAKRNVSAAYRVTGTPTVYLVGRHSKIMGRAIGGGETGREPRAGGCVRNSSGHERPRGSLKSAVGPDGSPGCRSRLRLAEPITLHGSRRRALPEGGAGGLEPDPTPRQRSHPANATGLDDVD
jgi:hypothetical protein